MPSEGAIHHITLFHQRLFALFPQANAMAITYRIA
jgi:hypothetical protein